MENGKKLSKLDHLRLRQGAERLRIVFRDLAVRDRQKAIQYLNDDKLRFPTLFILIPDIEALNLCEALTPRSNEALKLCAKKSGNSNLVSRLERLLPNDSYTAGALNWMITTGLYWDGPDRLYDSFDAVMDAAAALLVRTYGDKSILPAVSELIFRRNRKGLLIHDLVWSFFQAYDPDALKLIAKYLLSGNRKDVELACRLLHLAVPGNSGAARQKLYRQYIAWLTENKPYLHFTGEHFQQTSEPNPLQVVQQARYLGKQISHKYGTPVAPLTPDEVAYLVQFQNAAEEDRELLSNYSLRIHDRDIRLWEDWMHKNLSEQVFKAKSESQVV